MTQQLLDTEEFEVVNELDTSHLVIEDDIPVDNFQSAQQQRLLVDALCSSKAVPTPFIAEANVGLFYKLKGDPIVPDMLLSLNVQRAEDFSERQNRAYFVWEFGKVPEVCIEIVSNQEGDEVAASKKSLRKGKTTGKKNVYAQVGVPYYVVFDPLKQIQGEANMDGALLRVWTIAPGRYSELTSAKGIAVAGEFVWLESVGLGLTLWEGAFEEAVSRLWLRWCYREGNVIPTGAERADKQQERADKQQERADKQQERADKLAERLRAAGIDPDEV